MVELDESGRAINVCLFDEEDLHAALAELDRRYFAGEGAEHERVLRACGRWAAATERNDREALAAAMAPDFAMVDHRSLAYDATDRDAFIEQSLMRTDVARDDPTIYRLVRIDRKSVV